MSRDINDIERDIERAKARLAGTLDQIAGQLSPKGLVSGVGEKVKEPDVMKKIGIVAGALVAVVGAVVLAKRRDAKKVDTLRALLEEHRG
ncbi:MAG: DUF3618 domain-containing protein [Corynebacterium sp.]|nr:DUF3618 domain-containing protein [Corynebacterium sp.]